jgi:quinolinate synthase
MKKYEMIKKIEELKKQKNAVILAHNYQIGEIQDIADFVGDSLQLAKMAKTIEEDLIIFCGVKFMAESAKILNPEKRVLLPVLEAGCPMADMANAYDLIKMKNENPGVPVVTYVNSSAEVKAESDICCTSSNAVKVVESLKTDKIIFAPDKNLGTYVGEMCEGVEVLLWNGYCPTHHRVTISDIDALRSQYPDTKILVHPECRPDVFHKADFVGSTAQILDYARNSEDKQLIIGTEKGILHMLQKVSPDKKFILLSENLICLNMKKTGLSDVLKALEEETHEIFIDPKISGKAYMALERMLNL